MKRKITFFALAILALCASACKVEEPISGTGEVETMSFTAVTNVDASTKTTLVSDGSGHMVWVNWTEKDVISIFDGTANNRFDIDWQGESSKVEARFIGEAVSGQTAYYGLCPYQEGAALSGSNITANIPATQVIKTNNYDPAANIQIGVAANGKIPFKNACALIKVVVPDYMTEVSSIKISVSGRQGNADEGFVGNVTFNPSTGAVVSYGSGKTVTLTGNLKAGQTFYAAVAPGTYTGYTVEFKYNASIFSRTKTANVTFERNTIYGAANLADVAGEIGELPGCFSIDGAQQVMFSKGNLQFLASSDGTGTDLTHKTVDGSAAGTWRFAEHQYDALSKFGGNSKSTNWIDLFYFGSSGYNGYNPYSATAYGADINDTNYDWGVYNAISNGGNEPGMWRTLTQAEWTYLIATRNASTINGVSNARYVYANVASRNGAILFPDKCAWPSSITPPTASNINASGSGGTYTAEEWSVLEDSGLVFLPCCGYYNGYYDGTGSLGDYWSSTHSSSYGIQIKSTLYTYIPSGSYGMGFSFRLVKNISSVEESDTYNTSDYTVEDDVVL